MKIEKTLENLKKLYEHYTEEVKLLTEKRNRVQEALKEAETRMLQTFEAVQVLEGKNDTIGKLAESFGKRAGESKHLIEHQIAEQMSPVRGVETADATPVQTEASPNPDLPPAEPGMKWVKNELDEYVLVPINPPKPLQVSGVTFSGEADFALPPVEDAGWTDSPESFLT